MIFKAVETTKGVNQIKEFSENLHIQFKTAQILMQRGIDTKEKFEKFTNPTLNDLRNPYKLDGMQKCHDRIELAIKNNQRVLIFGDYDVDGISATAILYKFLKDKISNLFYFLPNRYEDGYGLTIDSAKKIIKKFNPNLIITVDCGISCATEVDYIKSCGIDIIITDHHEMPEVLPNTIVVDPKVPNQQYGFNGLCGAGVAMKVVETFVGREGLSEYLPICAIATVSDIVPLVDENRALVILGLKQQNLLPEGLKMLAKQLNLKSINSQAISFKLAPRLNATGRMGNAYYSLNLYISNDQKVINDSLNQVNQLNQQRQKLSQQIYDDCLKIISENKLYKNKAIILKSNTWDSGLLGIACARLVEDFNIPVFLFSDVDGTLKGSVRSIDSINIHKVLSNCSEYLETFGGHSMAAGLSLKTENYEKFKTEIFNYLNANTSAKLYTPIKNYDVAIDTSEVNLKLANELQLLEPFGCENPNPLFLITYKNCVVTKMQNFDQHINITIDNTLKLIAFNSGEYIDDYQLADTKQSIIELQINDFKGKQYLRGIVKKSLFNGYGRELQNISNGRVLKQYFSNQSYQNSIEFFDQNQTKTLLETLLEKPCGTAIVIYNYATYQKYKKLLDGFNLNYYVGGSQSKFEENCVIFALDFIADVSAYQNVIFLETLLAKNFLSGFNGKVYAIKNQPTNAQSLDLSRGTFGTIYNAIKNVIKNNYSYCNEIEFFQLIKRFNPQLSKLKYAQFVASLYTFLQLGLVKIDTQYGYTLYIDSDQKTTLENSNFYNNLKFISKLVS